MPSTPKSSNILNQVKPPAGRKVNHGALSTYAGKVNRIRAEEEARVAEVRKLAGRTPGPESDRQLADAEDHLSGVRGECNAALRGAVERVAAGDDAFTTESEMTPEQRLDREERSDRNRRDTERAHGLPSPTSAELETRALRREVQRLRADLGS